MLITSPKLLALFVTNQRKKLKLSQAEVGDRVGLKQQTISDFEMNPEGTRVETLFRLLSAINIDMNLLEKDAPNISDSSVKEGW